MGDERENQSILITSVDSRFSIHISTDICVVVNPALVKLRARRRLFHTLLQSPRTRMFLRHQAIPNLHLNHLSALCRLSVCLALLP